MNEKTLVAVFGYSGDAHQIRTAMPYYLHHKCPVVVLSPEDAPVLAKDISRAPEIQYRSAGKRAYIGPDSLVRQKLQLKKLLEFPHQFFLLNDSDSVCLSPRIPDYLYTNPDLLWSNIVSDEMHPRPEGYGYPRLAFQPPYFTSRNTIAKMLEVWDKVEPDPRTPFIDWVMMAVSVIAKVQYKNFEDGVSCPTNPGYEPGIQAMTEAVSRHGKVMLHSIKTREMLLKAAYARIQFKKRFKLS